MKLFKNENTRYQEWHELYEMARNYFAIPGVVKKSEHYLRSGVREDKYIDFDIIISDPVRCEQVARLFAAQIEEIGHSKNVDFLAFVDKGGEGTVGVIALAGVLEMFTNLPSVYVRAWKDVTQERVKPPKAIEGKHYLSGIRGILVTDHCTTGQEALDAVQILRGVGANVEDVVAYSYYAEKFNHELFSQEKVEFYSMYEAPEDLIKAGIDI
jgi:orotate phosphoribosyltransferase